MTIGLVKPGLNHHLVYPYIGIPGPIDEDTTAGRPVAVSFGTLQHTVIVSKKNALSEKRETFWVVLAVVFPSLLEVK